MGALLTKSGNSRSIVIFAHGSGSDRNGPRNRYVADIFNNAGISTLLMDLLTLQEEVIDKKTKQ